MTGGLLGRRRRRRGRSSRRRRLRRLGLKVLVPALGIGLVVLLTVRWLEAPPGDPEDACAVFREKPSWYGSLRESEETWGTPKAVQLAILFQESGFQARVRPPRRKILWILPWRRPSSAYGYGQILDGTWRDYQRLRDRPGARRSSFGDVADFVGWYCNQIHRGTGIEKTDAYGLYLAYHEGPGGYSRGSHRQKAWLLETAHRVAARARRYQGQLAGCEDSLRRALLRRRLIQTACLLLLLAAGGLLLRRRFRQS